MTKCLLEHKQCGIRPEDHTSFLPTRLIDVGSLGDPCLRLVLSDDLPQSKKSNYVTLSYSWGPGKHSVSTTVHYYGQRLASIPIDSLPATFGGAIMISRNLRICYLWIDAFCIIQRTKDDIEDWEKEFPLMGKIFSYSICTIAASGAGHNAVGCFSRRQAARWPVAVCRLYCTTKT